MPTDGRDTPLYTVSAGLFANRRVARILALAGYRLTLGLPGPGDFVAVWGAGRAARRGAALARLRSASLLYLEDAFLRSLHPGRSGDATIGLLIDRGGLHHDAARPCALETRLATDPLDCPRLLSRARAARAAMARAHLSKYSATLPDLPPPAPNPVIVVDQVRGDAATGSLDARAAFCTMLAAARADHPNAPILIKTHPETLAGHRPGHFGPRDLDHRTGFLTDPISPQSLFAHARAVYTHSSTLGIEAIWAGLKPRVFGTPIYAGWGLTEDRGAPLPRRGRALGTDQLFAAIMISHTTWYDPYRDRLTEIEEVIEGLEARARAWRDDRLGWTAGGMSRWKKPHLKAFFGTESGISFSDHPRPPRRHMAWARMAPAGAVHVEDGFLRSQGLGARLTPPLSLVLDDLGIHYDPCRPSRLEHLIAASENLTDAEIERASRLRERICALGLSKYNIIGISPPGLPPGPKVLVAGQVEDDASVLTGAGRIGTNAALLKAARRARPDAAILFKPHPDVEAGLRHGAIALPPDVIPVNGGDLNALLSQVDEVWTMTSQTGFEALLRGVPVTVTGAPFYAGWGLTRDLGPVPARRRARPGLDHLVHAALIAYPRYHDPVTNLPCGPEVIVERLAHGHVPRARGLLATLQGMRAFMSVSSRPQPVTRAQ